MEPLARFAVLAAAALVAACGRPPDETVDDTDAPQVDDTPEADTPPDPGGVVDSVDTTEPVDTPPDDTVDDTDAAPPGETAQADTPPAVPVEDCADPGDEDGDGLADCEDGDCVASCLEDCTAPGDEDNDGWTDCQDDECWGPACPPASQIAWVTQGRMSVHTASAFGGSCMYRGFSSAVVVAESVAGRVAVDRGGRWVSCDWQVPSARFEWRRSDVGWPTYTPIFGAYSVYWLHGCSEFTHTVAPPVSRRAGATVEPACRLSTVNFLPRYLTARHDRPISVTTPNGAAWYAAVSSTSHFGSGTGMFGMDVVARLGPGSPFGVCPAGAPIAAGAGWTCPP